MRYALISLPWDEISRRAIDSGSVAVVTLELGKRLAATHEVTVYVSRGHGQAAAEEFGPRLRVRRIRVTLRRAHKYLEMLASILQHAPPHFFSRGYFLEYYAQIALDLVRQRPDVVHVQGYPQIGPLVRRFCPNARLMLHLHGAEFARAPSNFRRRLLAPFDLIATCSQYVTAELASALPDLAVRLITVGNGVDTGSLRPSERMIDKDNSLKLLYVGRLSPEKGLHVLLDAFNRVVERRPQARLDVVGPVRLLAFSLVKLFDDDPGWASLGEFYGRTAVERLRRQVANNGELYLRHLRTTQSQNAAAATRFLGGVSHAETLRLYATADIAVVPSVCNEAFGIPVVEAMAAGLPVVATRSGAISGIVEDDRTGLLVPRYDHQSMADAIVALLDDPERRRAMGQAGRARVESRFTWDHVTQRLNAGLDRMVAGKPPAADAHGWLGASDK
jgi:glycosyltransferase involved in cell wall biosynthesis